MPVAGSMPGERKGWFFFAFGIVGASHSCVFRLPLGLRPRSARLFLRLLRAGDETLSDHQTGIAIRIATHATRWTPHEGGARGIAFYRLPLGIANYLGTAPGTLPAGVARIDAAGDDPHLPRLVFGVLEDAPLHPEGAFRIAPVAVLPFLWLEIREVLKDEHGSSVLSSKLDNPSAYQMGQSLIAVSDVLPASSIILLPFCHDLGL